MTAATLTHLPLAAGGALAASAGRAALWVIARYMRAPLAHTGLMALATFSLIAGSNALFLQERAHPAPLFGGTAQRTAVVAPAPAAVPPVIRPNRPVSQQPSAETTGSVPRAAEVPVGNAEVFELQRKLQALGLFDARIDGFYGPRTARAIREFEERHGLKVKGELTREIVARILGSASTAPPRAEPVAAPQPVAPPANIPAPSVPRVEPLAFTSRPAATPADLLPAQPVAEHKPVPLAASVSPMTVGTIAPPAPGEEPQRGLRRDLPATPEEALDVAAAAAGEAIETIIAGVQTVMMKAPVPAQPLPEKLAEPLLRAETVPVATAGAPPVSIGAAAFQETDRDTVSRVQQGLSRLGFLHGPVDGVAGEATAKAIRNFEVYYNYEVTGRITPELVGLLADNGAYT